MKAFKSGSGEIEYNKISDRQLGRIYSEIRDGFLKEMRVAENTGDLERIVNRQKAGVDSKFINSTIVAAALQVMNEDQKKFRIDDDGTESGQSGSTGIDSDAESGYNGERGESYADNERGRLESGVGERTGADRRAEEETGRAWRKNEKNDLRGAQEGQDGGRPQERIHVKQGSLDIYYKPGRADGSIGSSAVDILSDAGIDAVLCDGNIITGSGRAYSQALTMPDGTVYVSNNATLPALQIAAHEAVHSYELKGSEYYAEYEAVICDNLLWGSEQYISFATRFNGKHYNGKYDINSTDFAKLFVREVSAYVNQYVSTDMQRANERFSGIFSDWQSVVEASRQFNKNIGADFSESAFFAPESGAYESVFERLSGADGEADSHKRSNSEFFGTKVLTDEQKAVESVGKVLGVGVVFKNLDTSIKKADGKRELFRPNGYYDKSTNTIYINSSRSFEGDALMTVFKHELTHFTENASGPYDAFCDAAKGSKEFRAWLEGKTKRASDKNEGGNRSVDQMMAKLNSDIRELYSRRGIDIGVAGAQREIYADFAGDVLFARNGSAAENIINSLSIKQRPRFIEAIRDFLKFLREKLKGNRDITFGILMLETRYKNAALRAAEVAEVRSDGKSGTASGSKKLSYSISYTTDNKPVAVIDEDILSGVPKSKWVQEVKNIVSEKFTDGIPIGGRLIKVNSITRSEFTNSKYSKYLKSSDGTIYRDKFKSANNLDDIVLASTNYINEDLKHSRNDKFTEFARGDVLIRVGGNDYSAKVIVGFTSGNQMVLYDVINFMPATFKIKNEGDSIDLGKNRDLRNESSSDITVSQNEQSVNSSISEKAENDTESRKFSVSEEQKTDYGEVMDELLQKYESGEIEFAVKNGGVLYQNPDTNKVRQLLARNGLQLPTPLKLSDSDITVPQSEQSVNSSISENGNISYSISYTTDNEPVAVIDEDILSGVPKSKWVQEVKNIVSEKFTDGIPIGGRLIKVNKITRSEYTNSKYSQYLKSADGTVYQDKLKSANNLDDIILASTNYINEDLKHTRKDSFREFARGDVLIRVGGNDYSAKVIVGFTGSKQMVLYDVIDFDKTSFAIKEKTPQTAMQNAGSDRNGMSFDITVSQSEQSVNSSISEKAENDTENRKFSVSEEQKTDYGEVMDELLQKYESGEIDREVYKQRLSELFVGARVRHSGSSYIDSGAESGYNGERGESYADNDQRRLGENAENDSEADRRGEEKAGGAWRESKENDLRGAQEGQDGGRPQERIHVKQGSREIYYKPGRTDGGESYADNDQRRLGENAEEDSGIDRRGERKSQKTRRDHEKYDLRGAQEDQDGGRPQERIHVKQGSRDIYYKPGRTDGGESYVNNDKRKRLGEYAENDSEVDRRGEEETGRAWRKNEKNDLRGAQEGQDGGVRKERIYLKSGNLDVYHKSGAASHSIGSAAVDILNDAGIDAVLCDGDITTGSGRAYSEALTMPDGTVYVSSNATLPASQIAAHEAVHSYEVRGSEYYAEYEAVICDNLLWGSEQYISFATRFNGKHYNGKYDINSTDFAKLFVREVSAYVNQYVSTDMQRANERFSGIFSDWQSVVEASRQFNSNIGADFSGSAFFAPESGAYDCKRLC